KHDGARDRPSRSEDDRLRERARAHAAQLGGPERRGLDAEQVAGVRGLRELESPVGRGGGGHGRTDSLFSPAGSPAKGYGRGHAPPRLHRTSPGRALAGPPETSRGASRPEPSSTRSSTIATASPPETRSRTTPAVAGMTRANVPSAFVIPLTSGFGSSWRSAS